MAPATHRAWADVYVSDPTQRPALEGKALFFVVNAPSRCLEAHVSAADLAFAYTLQKARGEHAVLAGRSIHTKVLAGRPVSYESALGFINVSREPLAEGKQPPLETTDIVACVFRLKDPDQVALGLQADAGEIARGCNLAPRIVEAALARYRLQLVDALAIWGFCRSLQAIGRGAGNANLAARLTDDPRDFIRTDTRPPFAIKPVAEDGYVYSIGDLRAAPRSGHPWALDIDEANAAF